MSSMNPKLKSFLFLPFTFFVTVPTMKDIANICLGTTRVNIATSLQYFNVSRFHVKIPRRIS